MKYLYLQLLALPLTGFSFASTKPLAPNLVFEEKNGVVAVEAEHFVSQEKSDIRAWHITSTESTPSIQPDGDPSHAATASGGAYLELLPDTRRTHNDELIQKENFTNSPGQMAILTYPIHFTSAGRYYCWVRAFSTNTEDNGIHLGLNGTWPKSGARMQWTKKNEWAWDSQQRTEKVQIGVFGQIWIDIPAPGLHKIHFSMREDGFEFDKFILTTTKPDQKSPPKGVGPATRLKKGTLPNPSQIGAKPKPKARFPTHWGEQPKRQSRDMVPLPGNYGKGSSTLRNWIQKNLDQDAAKKGTTLKSEITEQKIAATTKLPDLQQPRKNHGDGSITITGANTQWQPVNLTLDGPFAYELDQKPNPFRDYALSVTFTHRSGAPEYHVPGYFAADGNAAETSAKFGTKWRAHFSPDQPGEWTYSTTFLTGKDIALLPASQFPDKPVGTLKQFNKSGKITIKAAPSDAPGFYAEGRLTYVSKPYLQFSGSKRYFLKAGADAPETLLGYADFDDTTTDTQKAPLKHYKPHLQDWKKGDPSWKNGKGKGLIGALNYLSGKGMNAFSFLPYNAGGDGDNVWPFTSRNQKLNYDCSKLDQWNIVFTHAQAKGLFLHFKLQETEMDDNNRGGHHGPKMRDVPTSLDSGDLGPERKLYCREIIARFGHHLALNWNLGEENTQTTKQQMDMANYIRAVDPYNHHLVVHTYPNMQDKVYNPLLGAEAFTGASLQNTHLKDVHWQTVKWHRASIQAGHPWGVAFDEPGNASEGTPPDPDYPGMPKDYKGQTIEQIRKWALWGNLLGGGWGVEYYFGYKLPQNDLICEDWRSRDQSWTYAKIALDFFRDQNIPIQDMSPNPEAVGNPEKGNKTYCLSGENIHVLAFPDGGSCDLKLPKGKSPKTIQWFNPRNGKIHPSTAQANNTITATDDNDWVAIIRTN